MKASAKNRGKGTTANKRRRRLQLQPYITGCIELERSMKLSRRSLNELSSKLDDFKSWSKTIPLYSLEYITADLLSTFLEHNSHRGKIYLKLAVWALRIFGAYLAVMQFLPDSPAKKLSPPRLPARHKLPEYLRPDELTMFINHLVGDRSLLDQSVLLLMCNAGLRPREVTQLRPRDINPLRRIVAVTVKGGWKRLLPISSALAEILEEYLQHYAILPNDNLFSNEWDRPIDVRWIERLTRKAVKGSGIRRKITPRMLRHTFATYMADRNGKQITRAFLGHSNSKSTDTYMHLIPGKYRRYMNMHPFQTDPGSADGND
jgi:integrase/recombinase XerD